MIHSSSVDAQNSNCQPTGIQRHGHSQGQVQLKGRSFQQKQLILSSPKKDVKTVGYQSDVSKFQGNEPARARRQSASTMGFLWPFLGREYLFPGETKKSQIVWP